ncbi:glycoside hydrolase family 47 protein [Cenococcum geophilum 1.58]|uniref:glycoside hydrolase family 47 protein n=1 Tax=Cenococcum geophilum 1.58 TaxID=794803 RepID=UPI00358E9997|nr:glycoside hydrolase family 47 protein [Cenococcum geophilum 1.58]
MFSNYRNKRTRLYAITVITLLSILYLFNQRADPLSFDSGRLEEYMNNGKHRKYTDISSFDWRGAPVQNTPQSFATIPTGKPLALPRIQYDFVAEKKPERVKRDKRQLAVRHAFQRAWNSYKKSAWMRDELKPISNEGKDTFGGWAATLVDALDTLWIMGLKEEFNEAVAAVATIDFGKTSSTTISVFETTIRYLGGLISAYDLSHEKVLLEKAVQVGEMLYRAFDTPNRMPIDRLDVEKAKLGEGFTADSHISIAGIGSLTMEFVRLAQLTGDAKYYDAVARVTDLLDRAQNTTKLPGMFPIWMNAYDQDLSYDSSFTLGAMADSVFEYFPKTFALLGGLEPVYKKLYENSMDMVDKHMLFRPMVPGREDILISGNVRAESANNTELDPEGQHLTCFVGGMFALGGRLFENKHHVDIGAKLAKGCIYTYKALPTGIMPEIFLMLPCASREACPWEQKKWEAEVIKRTHPVYLDDVNRAVKTERLPVGFTAIRDRKYILRPEAIESVFVLYRTTGQKEYQEAAWDMFTAVMNATSTAFANAAILDVSVIDEYPMQDDSMESFWLAETLKYFYLVFSPPDLISLDEFVLNTEAHPFRRPK